jgi:hypothetical protein
MSAILGSVTLVVILGMVVLLLVAIGLSSRDSDSKEKTPGIQRRK